MASENPYESLKIYDTDYDKAKEIKSDRGIPLIEAVGCALEGWKHLPRRVQDRIVRGRARRRPVAA